MRPTRSSWFFASAASLALVACSGSSATGSGPDAGAASPVSDAASRIESGSAETSSGYDTGSSTTNDASEPSATIAYTATLDGNQEAPVVATTATGTATFTLSADKTTLAYHVTHTVTGGIAAHIPPGAAGEKRRGQFPLPPVSAGLAGTIPPSR